MIDNTNWTPFPDDNILGLTDKNIINEYEAKGLATAELYVFELDTETPISTSLILEIHRIAFGQLYEWAGKWRTTQVTVGQLLPPLPNQVTQAMYQFIDNLNFKISVSNTQQRFCVMRAVCFIGKFELLLNCTKYPNYSPKSRAAKR
jgi:cell filamentation protein